VVHNYAYYVKVYKRAPPQPPLTEASSRCTPFDIGILPHSRARTTPLPTLSEKVRLAAERGHGVIYFYWEGLWGQYAGPEGGEARKQDLGRLHQSLFSAPLSPLGSRR